MINVLVELKCKGGYIMHKLNERLAAIRKQSGFTQQQLADMLNVSNKTISQWETGRALPDISMLVRLSEIYKLKLDELLNQEGQKSIPNDELVKTLLAGNYKDKLLIVYGLQLCGLILFFGIYFYLRHFSIPYAIKLVFDCISCLLAFHVYRNSQRYQVSKYTANQHLVNNLCLILITQFLVMPCSNTYLQFILPNMAPDIYLTFFDYLAFLPLILTGCTFLLLFFNALRISITQHIFNHIIVKLLILFILIVGISYGTYTKIVNSTTKQVFNTRQSYDLFKEKYEWLLYVYDLDKSDLADIDSTKLDEFIDDSDRLNEYHGIVGFDDEKLCVYKTNIQGEKAKWRPFLYTVFLILDGLSVMLLIRFNRKE